MFSAEKTIFAAATPVGESSITVIRLSGSEALSAAGSIFSKSKDMLSAADIDSFPSHTVHHGYIFSDGEVVDEAVLTVFKAPHSYTGEDIVEISTHGGAFVYRSIATLLVKQGVEHAQPGEFSKRAFLNGKLDLAQAEAIADLIRAKTELASKAALSQLKGELSKWVGDIRQELINYCSLVELELDFSEEGLEIVKKDELLGKIDNIIGKIEEMTQSYDSGRIIRGGFALAITGSPNVGKSTIFNYLLNDSRAIVSSVPGTTRDYLEESLLIGGYAFNLVDTAGIRAAKNSIEKEGIRQTHRKIDEADIVLSVIDLSNGALGKPCETGKTLTVFNKADIAKWRPDTGLCVSAKTGENMSELKASIIERAKSMVGRQPAGEVYVTNSRHKACLLKTCEYLSSARHLIVDGKGNELISFEIREAMAALGEIIGKTTNNDILNNIFAKFCIGK